MDRPGPSGVLFILSSMIICTTARPFNYSSDTWPIDVSIIPRASWGARPPVILPEPVPRKNFPVPYTIIHHSALDNDCSNLPCNRIVKSYQDLHMDKNGWNDIGYNFVIDPNGCIYEGRGWGVVGAHAVGYNVKSIGICLIGNFDEVMPTEDALRSVQRLIAYGIQMGRIREDYILHGHYQVRPSPTHCPGANLIPIIKTWPHFRNTTEIK